MFSFKIDDPRPFVSMQNFRFKILPFLSKTHNGLHYSSKIAICNYSNNTLKYQIWEDRRKPCLESCIMQKQTLHIKYMRYG